MLKFKLLLPNNEQNEIEVARTYSVADLKQEIQSQFKIEEQIDIIIFEKKLSDDAYVNKIIYNQEEDYLLIQLQNQLIKKPSKLCTFLKSTNQLLKQKAQKVKEMKEKQQSDENKNENQQQEEKENQEIKPKKMKTVAVLNLVIGATSKMLTNYKKKQNKLKDQMKSASQPSQIQDIRHEDQLEEEQQQQNNNDTVLGLLDDLSKLRKDQVHKVKKQSRQNTQKHSPSPQAQEYLKRKRKAESLLKDQTQNDKAKNLVHELRKQKQLIEYRRQKQHELSSELLDQSVEQYRREREETVERMNQEKRERIQRKLDEMKKNHELKQELKKQQNQTIKQLRDKNKLKMESFKHRGEILQQLELEDAKLKIQEKKQQAKPIRLEDINKHAEQYQENRQMLKLQRDQKKLEWEIKIQQETKQVYTSKKMLEEIKRQDENEKGKEQTDKRQRRDKLRRKLKYAELIQEFHKPQSKMDIEQLRFSKIDPQALLDNSQQEEFAEFLKGRDLKASNSSKKNSLAEEITRQGGYRYEKSVKKIQSVLSQQSIPKTKVTERLQLGKLPDPSVYYQSRVKEQTLEKQAEPKYKNYLKDLKLNREQHHSPQTAGPKTEKHASDPIYQMKKIEEQAKRKEALAKVKKDEGLQDEATELFLQSIQAKLVYLQNNT